MTKCVLVTGAAGFIGSHTAEALLARGDRVVGLDSFDAYYAVERKRANAEEVRSAYPDEGRFLLVEGDIRDEDLVRSLFARHSFDAVVHLAAMAGVRASIDKPHVYYDVNLGGTLNLLEAARACGQPHFIFASTSSVYGSTRETVFVETLAADRPLAPYPASKRAAELLGHAYHHAHGQTFTALRFFTVYGPRNRPDMMAHMLLDNVYTGRLVELYNEGRMHRDWTFVGDTVKGVVAAVDRPFGYEVINLGRGDSVLLADFVSIVEEQTGRKTSLGAAPMHRADVPYTCASIDRARELLEYDPRVSVEEGVAELIRWYQQAERGTPAR